MRWAAVGRGRRRGRRWAAVNDGGLVEAVTLASVAGAGLAAAGRDGPWLVLAKTRESLATAWGASRY